MDSSLEPRVKHPSPPPTGQDLCLDDILINIWKKGQYMLIALKVIEMCKIVQYKHKQTHLCTGKR